MITCFLMGKVTKVTAVTLHLESTTNLVTFRSGHNEGKLTDKNDVMRNYISKRASDRYDSSSIDD